MRIALVHDYIKEYGGAERVLETFHDMYPKAPIFTLVYCPEFLGPHKERFKNWDIRPSFLQLLPFKEKFISPFRLIAPIVFKLFDFSGYEVIVVSSTGAYIPNCINKQSAKQICYCHTPPRYLYGYATAREWKKYPPFRVLAEIVNHFLRLVDFSAAQHVDVFIANSENVRNRINKFYRRDAIVIYPPVEMPSKKILIQAEHSNSRKYFLTGGRLARPKHIDLIIRVANELHMQLKIFGKSFAGYGDELQNLAGPTVEFLGEITDEEKAVLMIGAKAFLFAGEDEDFGILPVEAMSFGTPVIAYKSGGVVESIVQGKTGIFFQDLTVSSLSKTITHFKQLSLNAHICQKHAQKFAKEVFVKKMTAVMNKII